MKTDRRRKLTPEQENEIRALKKKHGRSMGDGKLALQFGVSKRTIQFILTPSKLEANRQLARERKQSKN